MIYVVIPVFPNPNAGMADLIVVSQAIIILGISGLLYGIYDLYIRKLFRRSSRSETE